MTPRLALLLSFVAFLIAPMQAQDLGFAEGVTGGEGGVTIVVRTPEEFEKAVTGSSAEKRVVQVEGTIRIGSVRVSSNRSIIGRGSNPTLVGNIHIRDGISNIIIRNLTITNPSAPGNEDTNDGITITGGKLVWIDHCTFHDCSDGCVDVIRGSDRVTVSWCKFYYSDQAKHRFTMLAMGTDEDDKKDKKKKATTLRITLHHNWWAEGCDQRMPAARDAEVHMYNNYFSCVGNSYCSNARPGAEMLSENNFYDGVKNPCYAESGAALKTVGNIYANCHGKMENRNDKVFTPPYRYSPADTRSVPEMVRAGAGAR